jgi:hypothetical protein
MITQAADSNHSNTLSFTPLSTEGRPGEALEPSYKMILFPLPTVISSQNFLYEITLLFVSLSMTPDFLGLCDHLAVCVSVYARNVFVFYAIHVVSKECRRLVLPRTPC